MANVFEFHFNPLPKRGSIENGASKYKRFGFLPNNNFKKENSFFETFCFLPKTFFEKKQGNLYIVTEVKSHNNQSKVIVNYLADTIKKYFYQKPIFSSHDSFQLGLNQANDFLKQEVTEKDHSFLSNLHFASLVTGPKRNIKISKIGNIKIILLRGNQAFDIGANFTVERINDKIFPDVIEGTLQKGDRILMATPEVFQSFQAEKIIEQLCLCDNPKLVKQVFKEKKKIVREFSGACLLTFIKKNHLISLLSRFLK